MKKIISNSWKIGILIMAITALLLVGAVPTMAASTPSTPSLHNVQGKVLSISGTSSLVIQNGNQAPITVNVDNNTKYYQVPLGKAQAYVKGVINKDNIKAKLAGKPLPPIAADLRNAHIPANWKENLGWLDSFEKKAQFSDIQVGDRIIARVTNDANNLAKQVLIIKAPAIQQIKGTISAVSSNSTTITPINSGTPVTVNITENTRIVLKGLLSVQAGQYAVALYNKNTLAAQTINIQATAPTPPTKPTLTAITVTSTVSGNLTVGATRQFTATATFSNGSTTNITSQVSWASSNTSVATIESSGQVKAKSAGTADLTASKNGIISPEVTLTVTNP